MERALNENYLAIRVSSFHYLIPVCDIETIIILNKEYSGRCVAGIINDVQLNERTVHVIPIQNYLESKEDSLYVVSKSSVHILIKSINISDNTGIALMGDALIDVYAIRPERLRKPVLPFVSRDRSIIEAQYDKISPYYLINTKHLAETIIRETQENIK